MKNLAKILPLLLLVAITATLLAGCGGGGHRYYDDYYITIINDTPWDVYVEPFAIFLAPGDRVDIDVGYDVFRIVAFRDFDGVILAEVNMGGGDVLVIQ